MPTLEEKYFIKKQEIYEVVFMSVGKNINGHKSTIVADESQVYIALCIRWQNQVLKKT